MECKGWIFTCKSNSNIFFTIRILIAVKIENLFKIFSKVNSLISYLQNHSETLSIFGSRPIYFDNTNAYSDSYRVGYFGLEVIWNWSGND